MRNLSEIRNSELRDVTEEEFKYLLEYIDFLEEKEHPDNCQHLWTTSQGIGRSSICGQCGIEL